MTYKVVPSIFAKDDKKSIIEYLSQYSVNAPVKFKNEMKRYFGIIGQTPDIFARYNANPAYRHVVVYGSYVMFYTVNETDKIVYVYRILHGAKTSSDYFNLSRPCACKYFFAV